MYHDADLPKKHPVTEEKDIGVDGDVSIGPFSDTEKGGKAYNEDAVYYFKSDKLVIGAIFDGHGGYNGMLAAQNCVKYCKEEFEQQVTVLEAYSLPQWKEYLHSLFGRLHSSIQKILVDVGAESNDPRYVDAKGVIRGSRDDPVHGGTTASICVQFMSSDEGPILISANVGDSHSFLCSRNSRKTEFLTVDHGPENHDEFNRFKALPETDFPIKLMFVYDKVNVQRKYDCPRVFNDDGTKDPSYVADPWSYGLHPTNVRYEPAVYAVTPRTVTRDATCIAMTRSLGDFYAQQFGLSWEPSITVRRFETHHAKDESRELDATLECFPDGREDSEYTVVVATDGVWDCWKYNDFVDYFNDQLTSFKGNIKTTVQMVLKETIKRAKHNFGIRHFDDASLICWRLKL